MLNTAKRQAAGAGSLWRVSPALLPIVLLGSLFAGCGACSCPGGEPLPGSDGDIWPGSDTAVWDAGSDSAAPGSDGGLIGTDGSVLCQGPDLFWSEVSHDKENAVVTIHNWHCQPIGPIIPTLYLFAELCYGTVVELERLDEATGAFVPLARAYDCALGGPTDPIPIAAGEDYVVVFGRNDWFNSGPGTFRVVFWVSDSWSCPSGDIAMCVWDHPWQVHTTPAFYWSN